MTAFQAEEKSLLLRSTDIRDELRTKTQMQLQGLIAQKLRVPTDFLEMLLIPGTPIGYLNPDASVHVGWKVKLVAPEWKQNVTIQVEFEGMIMTHQIWKCQLYEQLLDQLHTYPRCGSDRILALTNGQQIREDISIHDLESPPCFRNRSGWSAEN
jgi:hypothetical protein